MLPRLLLLITVALAATSPRTAVADAKSDAAALVTKADQDYKLGRFEDALVGYSKAYELFAAPPLLFNLGQCHFQLRQWERAVFFYEGYLRARPKAKNRALVDELLAEAKGKLDKERAETAAKQAEEAARAKREAEEKERLRIDAEKVRLDEESKLKVDAERKRLDDERAAAERRRREDERLKAADRERQEREARERDKIYRKWWFWTAVGGVVAATGGTLYYFSGETTVIQPMGSLGSIDQR